MKSVFKMTGVAAFFLALLLPQLSYGQTRLEIGDIHKGGIVFQVNNDGTGLICQTKDLGKMDWAEAVAACKKLRNGWRLPTKDELESMYVNLHRKRRGGFKQDYYWSSTEKEDLVWDQNFDDGEPNSVEKLSNSDNVRAVRTVSLNKQQKARTNTKVKDKPKVKTKTKDNRSSSSGKLKTGDTHQGGFVFYVDPIGQGIVCSFRTLGELNYADAVAKCESYSSGGYSDWRLPSEDELNMIYSNLYMKSIGDFGKKGYWTSNNNDPMNGSDVLGHNFGNNIKYWYAANATYVNAIAVRDFPTNPSKKANTKQPKKVKAPQKSKIDKRRTSITPTSNEKVTQKKTLKIGDPHAGGYVFQIHPNGGLVCSKELGSYKWNKVKDVCESYGGGGHTDWRMPTKDELNQMYLQKNKIGGFAADSYWSSTEGDPNYNAWYQNFKIGGQYNTSKNRIGYVRAVRAF